MYNYYSIGSFLYKIILPKTNTNWSFIGPCNKGMEVIINTNTIFRVISSEIKRIIVPKYDSITIIKIPFITIELENTKLQESLL